MINPVFYSRPPVMHDRYPNNQTHSLYCNILSYRQEKHQESLKHWCQSNVCFLNRLLLFHHFFNFLGKMYEYMRLDVHESVKERERYIETKRDRETLHVKALHFDLRHSGWRWPIDSKFPTHNHFKIQLCVNTARMMASHGIWCFLCICSKAPQHYGSLCIAKAL